MRTATWFLIWFSGIALWAWLLTTPETAPEDGHAAPPTLADRLLGWPLARLHALELERDGIRRRIERAGSGVTAGWVYRDPVPARAGDANGGDVQAPPHDGDFIVAHLNMFAAARIERAFAVPARSLGDYGIGPDGLRARLYIADRAAPARILSIGARTPDGFGQYVWLEPDAKIVTVPAYHIDNLTALLAGPRPAP